MNTSIMRILGLALGLVLQFSCGRSDACKDLSFLGSWQSTGDGATDILTFRKNCTGTSVYCQSQFEFHKSDLSSGSYDVEVTETLGKSGCLPKGSALCTYTVTDDSLLLICGSSGSAGGGLGTYRKL